MDSANWETTYIKGHRRGKFPRKNSSPADTCTDFALSFFNSEASARATWNTITLKNRANMGFTAICRGNISKGDGLCSPDDHQGHFNLFEYAGSAPNKQFRIVSKLP